MAIGMSEMITVISTAFNPIVWLLNISTNGVLRLLGIDPKADDDNVTEEEILMMSDAGAEKGTIDANDNLIIKNIFAFDDIEIGQICTHRTDMTFLNEYDDDEQWCDIIQDSCYNRIPICGDNIDKITGILDTITD